MANNKQLIIVVDGSTAVGPHWSNILYNYLDKIIRYCSGNDMTGQPSSSSTAFGSTFQFALAMFTGHRSAYITQRSRWTSDVNEFLG